MLVEERGGTGVEGRREAQAYLVPAYTQHGPLVSIHGLSLSLAIRTNFIYPDLTTKDKQLFSTRYITSKSPTCLNDPIIQMRARTEEVKDSASAHREPKPKRDHSKQEPQHWTHIIIPTRHCQVIRLGRERNRRDRITGGVRNLDILLRRVRIHGGRARRAAKERHFQDSKLARFSGVRQCSAPGMGIRVSNYQGFRVLEYWSFGLSELDEC